MSGTTQKALRNKGKTRSEAGSRGGKRGTGARRGEALGKPLSGPLLIARVVRILCAKRADEPDRAVSVDELSRQTGLTYDELTRLLPGVMLRTHAILPRHLPTGAVIGFYLGDWAWVEDAAVVQRQRAQSLIAESEGLWAMSRRLDGVPPDADSEDEADAAVAVAAC